MAISGAKANIMHFCIDFEVKIDEKQRFFDCVFGLLHALFENLANLENRRFTLGKIMIFNNSPFL